MATTSGGGAIVLKNPQADCPIKDAEQLVLVGYGYSSEKEAYEVGLRYQAALTVALARVRVGADFGERPNKGGFTSDGIAVLERELSGRVLNDVHGLMVYRTDPKPRFVSMEGRGIRGIKPAAFLAAFDASVSRGHLLPPRESPEQLRESLAYSLFNAALFQSAPEHRFILLVMAIEALIDPLPRSPEVQQHVERLVEETQTANIPEEERKSLLGALKWLRNESILQAGKRLAEVRLCDLSYQGQSAPKFFARCYDLRSQLVHGTLSVARIPEIQSVAATLEEFVSDLLTAPILGCPQQR